MIGQYLTQTNEIATVAKSKKFSHLDKAHIFFIPAKLNSHYETPTWGVYANSFGLTQTLK